MVYLFATESLIPMRAESSESSEMVSQLVFGDLTTVMETNGNWVKVQNLEDKYEGWVDRKMLTEVSTKYVGMIKGWHFVLQNGGSLELPDKSKLYIPMGARIPITVGTVKSGQIRMGPELFWKIPDPPLETIGRQPFSEVIPLAKRFINTPYLWGGRSGYGIDCSGFAQIVYRMCGISLPRDARLQQEVGEVIPFEKRRRGDLAFFSKPNKMNITHVGIVEDGHRLIHASGKVRYDMLVKNGIFRVEDESIMTHKLVSINRYKSLIE